MWNLDYADHMISMSAEYKAALPEWERARDCLAGELAVKAKGEIYLPRLDSQTDAEYAAYVKRAAFFAAAARVLEDCLTAAFKRSPEFQLPTVSPLLDLLQRFIADCDLAGSGFVDYSRHVLEQVLSVARAGSLVLWDNELGRPWVSMWKAEQIVDWRYERVKGRLCLVRLVLRESGGPTVILWLHRGKCVREVWHGQRVRGRSYLMHGHAFVPLIPFVFHAPRGASGDVERSPLDAIISNNLDHYRLSADCRHGLHLAALPTAWVSGFDKASPLRVGSSEAWISEVPGATAGFLEFKGTGLSHIERALALVQGQMQEQGARLLGRNENGSTGEAGLAGCVRALSGSLSRVLGLACSWCSGEWSPALPQVGICLADVGASTIKGAELSAIVEAWKAGAISRESLLESLRRGDVLPDGRSVAQEKALLYRAK